MRSFVFVWLFVCSFAVHANIVPFECYYTGTAQSHCERDGVDYSLRETTANGLANAYDTTYPYNGGAAVNTATGGSFPDTIQVIAQYPAASYLSSETLECWSSVYVTGYIETVATEDYPLGALLELEITYGTIDIFSDTDYLSRGVIVKDQDNNIVWTGNHSTDGVLETYSIQIIVGERYTFQTWQYFGTSASPIIPDETKFSAVIFNFTLVPEPASAVLFGLGALLLRKKK